MKTKEEISSIVKTMSLEDKIALCSGENFWETKKFEKYGIPAMFMSDGPHGLRKQDAGVGTDMLGLNDSVPATCFPAEVTTAGSWDVDLLERIGTAVGKEARYQKVGLVLGPGANIKRNPLCGRNFEYFSEDPYLAGKLAAGFICGVESQGVGTSLKHFACNSQERDRFTSDSVVDERTLREIYLSAFEIAVMEGRPSTVMCAYPKLNGVHCSDNQTLLTDILRKEWGFNGMVVTDWGAMNDRIKGFQAGCDLSMPGGSAFMEKEVAGAVLKGTLSESLINASAERILTLVYRAGETLENEGLSCIEENHELAIEAAAKGAVLLKNDSDILPINENVEKIAVIGSMAKAMRYQGAGSSHINPTKLTAPLDYFKNASYATGCNDKGETTTQLLTEAGEIAANADKVIIFAGLPGNYESEGFDRDTMTMPEGHIRMIEEVSKANPNTVVVLFSGCVVECSWEEQVKGILYMGLPGQGGGEAVYCLLTGKANPCGKLAETWPYEYQDVPSSDIYARQKDALYEEGLYIGYRYYDKAGIKVRWPFGYGLSYTTFSYSDLAVEKDKVTVTVTNTGETFGEEIVQLYVARIGQDGIHRPVRELKGFCKVALDAKESKTVTLPLEERSFAVWKDKWVVEAGTYEISVSGLHARLQIGGEALTCKDKSGWYWLLQGKPDKASWEKELGRAYIQPVLKKGCFTMDNTVEEMKDYSLLMKMVYKSTERVVAKQFGGKADYDNPDFKMLMKSSAGGPLRSMQISSGMKGGLFEGLLEMANGHIMRGIFKMLKR